MPAKEWTEKYNQVKEKLNCPVDLDAYFSESCIGKTKVDHLEIGEVDFPTGTVFACDPLVELGEALPYIQTVPVGTYPVTICVIPSEKYGDRYACVKVSISDKRPIRYELGMLGDENLEELEDGDFFGFIVDAGMGCIADIKAQEAFRKYWTQRESTEDGIDPYNDLFCDLLEENYKANPKYQRDGGDWLNWTVPGTDCNIPIFASGWGDGVYPCYFGYDGDGSVCGIYLLFINIEEEFSEDLENEL